MGEADKLDHLLSCGCEKGFFWLGVRGVGVGFECGIDFCCDAL